MSKKRTRADILREIADLEDELSMLDECYLERRYNGEPKLNYEFIEDDIYKLRKELAGVGHKKNVNMKAYEYHIISDVELDFDKIIEYGIKGIIL